MNFEVGALNAPGATRLNVLLVDDDSDDSAIFEKMLARLPGVRFQLTWSRSYASGLELIRKGGYDMHFLDYRLGPSDGLELMAQALSTNPDKPFVIVTGYGDEKLAAEARRRGATGYLSKADMCADTLARCIRSSLAEVERRTGRASTPSAAGMDLLTGLPGDRLFLSAAENCIWTRLESNSHWVSLFVEVDNVSNLRHDWGNEVADTTLRAVADVIRACVAQADPVGRYGDSAFCVLAACPGRAEARALGEKIRAAVEQGTDATVSIGVAAEPARIARLNTLLAGAGIAAREAVTFGRNRVELWQPT